MRLCLHVQFARALLLLPVRATLLLLLTHPPVFRRKARQTLCACRPDSIRQHTSAYVSIRQHTSAYVSIRQHTSAYVSIRQHTSAYVARQGELYVLVVLIHSMSDMPAYVSIHQHMSAYLSELYMFVVLINSVYVLAYIFPPVVAIRQHTHTSAYVSIPMSAYVRIRYVVCMYPHTNFLLICSVHVLVSLFPPDMQYVCISILCISILTSS
jgi:hypothetical protein